MDAKDQIKDLLVSITGETDQAIIDAHTESFMDICKIYTQSEAPTQISDEEIRQVILDSGEGSYKIGDTSLEYVDTVEITLLVSDLKELFSKAREPKEGSINMRLCDTCSAVLKSSEKLICDNCMDANSKP